MIESLQKLIPWLVGLSLMPKLMFSLALVLLTAFLLALIWSAPSTPTVTAAGHLSSQQPAPSSGASATQPSAEIVGPSIVVAGRRAIYRADFDGELEFEWHYTQPVKLTDRNIFIELGYPGQTETLTLRVKSRDGRIYSTSKMITAIAAP